MTVLIATAMAEEARPHSRDWSPIDVPLGEAWEVAMGRNTAVVLKTGIGLVTAATAVTAAIGALSPSAIISSGSAGGLSQGIFVGDVVLGTSFAYHDADTTAFGYAYGQVPGMPEFYESDPHLLELAATARRDYKLRRGRIVSGNSFIADHLVDGVRAAFPSALAADMETTALAQVAYLYGIPFVAVRAISDLCGPTASKDFSVSLDVAATRSAAVVTSIVEGF